MIIGFDLDDVLVPFTEGLFEFHNDNFGTDLRYGDVRNIEAVWELFGCDRKEGFSRIGHFYDSSDFDRMTPYAGAVSVVNHLRVGGDVSYVVTKRYGRGLEKTPGFLREFFRGGISKILSSHANDASGVGKGELCAREGVYVMVEDMPSNALSCAENGVRVLLMDRPWNQDVDTRGLVTRVYSLWEAVREIEDLR